MGTAPLAGSGGQHVGNGANYGLGRADLFGDLGRHDDRDDVPQRRAASEIELDADIVASLEALVNANTVSGARYAPAMQATVDTEG